jgi:hypothetical protein
MKGGFCSKVVQLGILKITLSFQWTQYQTQPCTCLKLQLKPKTRWPHKMCANLKVYDLIVGTFNSIYNIDHWIEVEFPQLDSNWIAITKMVISDFKARVEM